MKPTRQMQPRAKTSEIDAIVSTGLIGHQELDATLTVMVTEGTHCPFRRHEADP
jgi:hypothetical protein